MARVSCDYVDIRHAAETLQQARAMGMQLRRKHSGARVAACKQRSLTAGSRTTIENRLSTAGQQRDQLRSFILNRDAAFLIGAGSSYVSRNHAPCRRQQSTRRKLYAGCGKFCIRLMVVSLIVVSLLVVSLLVVSLIVVNVNCRAG